MLIKNLVQILLRLVLFIFLFFIVGLTLQSQDYATAVGLAIASLVDYIVFERKRWIIGFTMDRLTSDFSKGMVAGFLTLITIYAIVYLFGGHKLVGVAFDKEAILIWFVICLVVALSEEIFIRGYVYGRLRYLFSGLVASVISSGLFAALHIFRAGFTLTAFTTLFFAGIMYAFMREKSGALWLPVGFHFAWNYTSGILGIWRGEQLVLITESSQGTLIHGGVYGIEGSIVTALLFLILTAVIGFRIVRDVTPRVQMKR